MESLLEDSTRDEEEGGGGGRIGVEEEE